ncbi:GspE/PulE family protein [Vreelandella utahensis]|uniref:GspE/PulE family protein n=1 Tax=Vreelandella halophila TaxID=86177 RepID=UPI0009862C25|nr:GspE/PulE family protein [Halomonas utahensis]
MAKAPKPGRDQPLSLHQVCDALVQDERITEEEARDVRNANLGSDGQKHPLEMLADAQLQDATTGKLLYLDTLTEWLAHWSGLDYVHIDPLKVDVPSVADVMSYAYAQRNGILAVKVTRDEVQVATTQPFQREWISNLEHITRRTVTPVVANPAAIRRFTVEFYQLANSVSKAGGEDASKHVQSFEQLLDLSDGKADANDQHVVSIVDWLLHYAFEQRASDIHIEPRREMSQVRFRIDGVLHTVYEFPINVGIAVLSRLKILGRLNVAEKRRPQDGRIKTRKQDESEVELRIATMPTAFGEKMVLRIFDPDVLLKPFEQMGFSRDDRERWQRITDNPYGIILVTGPTGSGKTTTLYSTLRQMASDDVNICTIEDPIEMVEPAFNQMQVQHGIDLTFAHGVRALLRQDPDIIMIGEIRDQETADMAVQGALTGHLVLSTLHTNDAPSAITRLLELGLPSYLIRATVIGVMAQRLVRTLCTGCKTEGSIDTEAWRTLTKPWKAPTPEHPCEPVGCLQCRNTGYLGRSGVYEIMPVEGAVEDLITADCDVNQLRREAYRQGMMSLRLSGAQKVAAGLTTVEEVMRVTPESQR